jgi:hypothetical protein
MQLVVYAQYYRCKSADRQREIDECLRRNLNHPGIAKVVLFKEADAPPLPQASVPVEVVESDERITYAEWLRWVKRQGSGIALLLNAGIVLDEGLEHLAATFDTPESTLALTRHNLAMPAFMSTTSTTGPRTRGAYGPMRNCRRACPRPIKGPHRYSTKTKRMPNIILDTEPYTQPKRP